MSSLDPCSRTPRPKMTTRERLFLPAWEKWTKYGRVPWKIIYNLLLVLTVTTKVRDQGGQACVWA